MYAKSAHGWGEGGGGGGGATSFPGPFQGKGPGNEVGGGDISPQCLKDYVPPKEVVIL